MGDRTFTAEDVLRIYEDYLDESEMQTVEDFFKPEEEIDISLLPLVAVRNLLAVLEPLLAIIASFPVALLVGLIGGIARRALTLAIPALAGIIRILKVIIAIEEALDA